MVTALVLLLLWSASSLAAETFLCAGTGYATDVGGTAKVAAAPMRARTGTRNALIVFARFADSDAAVRPPDWSSRFFDPDTPGPFSHFYDTMSQSRLRVRGEAAPRYYRASRPSADYVGDTGNTSGRYGNLVAEILPQVDRDIDFRRFDNDGADGVPDSGDDDGVVDALFIILPETPVNFYRGPATGIANLGIGSDYLTNDVGTHSVIRVVPNQGTVQQGRTFAEAVGTVCHEFGHLLGLPDLFDTAFLRAPEPLPPARDSAGIGRWGLMGWGALGWHGDDGPASLSAWSRDFLGWTQTRQTHTALERLALADIGLSGDVFVIPLAARERFLLEYRSARSSYYDRNIPGEGLLIWHDMGSSPLASYNVDLVAADGRWRDSGSPTGRIPAPEDGEDNLDFWAHDAEYTAAHRGNLGDASDPFDGSRHQQFTPETNPSARSADGTRSIRIENIRLQSDSVYALVSTAPARLQLTTWFLDDANGDRVLSPDEEAGLTLRIGNVGGLSLTDVMAHVRSSDSLVSVLDSVVRFGTVDVGRVSGVPLTPFARLLATDFPGERDLAVSVSLSSTQSASVDTTILIPAVASFAFQGRILNEEGDPMGGTWLRLGGPRLYTIVSNPDGFFSGTVLPGDYDLNITPLPPFLETYRKLRVVADTHVDYTMRRGVLFGGAVVDHAGEAVSQALISIGGQFAATGQDGRFLLFAPRGRHLVQITSPRESMLPNMRQWITVDGNLDLVFTLQPGISVQLQFAAATNATLPSWTYLVGDAAFSSVQPVDGVATHWVHPGIFRLSARLGDGDTDYGTIFHATADTILSIDLPTTVAIGGRLIDGGSVPGLKPTLAFVSRSTPQQTRVPVSVEGAFLAQLSDGHHSVRLRGNSGSTPGQVIDTIVVRGPRSDLELAPLDGRPIAGRLLHDGGMPASKAEVRFSSTVARAWAFAAFQADGSFGTFVLPGTYVASIRIDSSLFTTAPLALPGPVELELPADGVVGFLRDPPGPGDLPSLVAVVDDPMSLFALQYVRDVNSYMLIAAPRTSADLVGMAGGFALPAGRYLLALPARGNGFGPVIDLAAETIPSRLRVGLPPASADTLYGLVSARFEANVSGAILRLYDARTHIVAQTSIIDGSGGFILPVPPGTYRGRLGLLDADLGLQQQFELGTIIVDGSRRWDIELADVATAVTSASLAPLPHEAELTQNYPNPFNAQTVISMHLPASGEVRLEVFDILGRRVASLLDEHLPAGLHAARWDGRDQAGRAVGSGVYLYRLRFGSHHATRKLLLLR